MKNNKVRKRIAVCNAVIILLAVLLTGFFAWSVISGEASFSKTFPRMAVALVSCVGALVKINGSTGRRMSLDKIEAAYIEDIGDVFRPRPMLRKKLLCAIRLYNESNYRKSVKYLLDLAKRSEGAEEYTVSMMFVALNFTDAGVYQAAVNAYMRILDVEPSNATAHSNLGMLYVEMGEYEAAVGEYDMAIAYDREHYYAYSNRANCYFKMGRDDLATEDALRALEIKNNGREAAGLLYVLYSLSGDTENRDKYCRVAVSAGASREILDRAVASCRAERESAADGAEEDEEITE